VSLINRAAESVLDELAAQYWQEWLEAGNLESDEGGRHLKALVGEAHKITFSGLSYEDTLAGLAKVEYILHYIGPLCEREPLLTQFEASSAIFKQIYMGMEVILGNWPLALSYCREIVELQQRGDERRERLGIAEPRTAIENWMYLLAHMAIIKCEGAPELRDEIFSAEQTVARLHAYVRRSLGVYRTVNATEKHISNGMEATTMAGLDLAKLAYRYAPERLAELLPELRAELGLPLEAAPAHFKQPGAECPDNTWYWDFELYKLYTAGALTEADLDHCTLERMRCVPLTLSDRPLEGLFRCWERRAGNMRAQMRRSFELVEQQG
jgi:hypothetical protein